MPSKITPLISGETYHVYNRGADKRAVFLNKLDYMRFYRTLLQFNIEEPTTGLRQAEETDLSNKNPLVAIKAYSLLPNHFHLLVTQVVDGGLSEYMKRIGGGYTNYFNKKYKRSGVLFQGKFKRVLVKSDMQYQYLFAYVNENHSVHNIPIKRKNYHTSSLHYQGVALNDVLATDSGINQYSLRENLRLAQEIYKKRQSSQNNDLFE